MKQTKMNIQTIETLSFTSKAGLYMVSKLQCDTISATITEFIGKENYINVTVHNAANKIWKGLGKQYPNREVAAAAYKNAKIKAMINYTHE